MEMKHSAFSTLKPVETENPGKIKKEERIQTKKANGITALPSWDLVPPRQVVRRTSK